MPLFHKKNQRYFKQILIFSLTYKPKTHIIMGHMLVCIKKYKYFGGVINEKNISTK